MPCRENCQCSSSLFSSIFNSINMSCVGKKGIDIMCNCCLSPVGVSEHVFFALKAATEKCFLLQGVYPVRVEVRHNSSNFLREEKVQLYVQIFFLSLSFEK